MTRIVFLLVACLGVSSSLEGSGEHDDPIVISLPPGRIFEGGVTCRCYHEGNLVGEYKKKEDMKSTCPHGWTAFRESCYFIGYNEMQRFRAERHCEQFNSSLVVANTVEEWDFILDFSRKDEYTWIGMFKENETVPDNMLWEGADGLDIKYLKWPTWPPLTRNDGWTASTRCAAVYSHDHEYNYVNFYSCSFAYNFICERNSTLH